MIVDDDRDVAEILREALERDGHIVETAPDGQKALALLADRRFDVVLADLRMPVVDGRAFFREASRRDPDLAHRFIFMTGDPLGRETREVIAEGAHHHVDKPFTVDELRRRIDDVLKDSPR